VRGLEKEGRRRESDASLETHHRDVEDGVVILEEVGERAVGTRVSSDGSTPLASIRIRRASGDVGGDGVSREEVDRDGGVRPHHCRENRKSKLVRGGDRERQIREDAGTN